MIENKAKAQSRNDLLPSSDVIQIPNPNKIRATTI